MPVSNERERFHAKLDIIPNRRTSYRRVLLTRAFLETIVPTQIEHSAHTSFRVSRNGALFLIDPLQVQPSPFLRERGLPRWPLDVPPDIDAVILSHAHDDHLHPPSLLGLPRSTRTYCYGSRAHQQLSSLGFERPTLLEIGTTVSLGQDVRVVPIPAASSVEGIEQCALIIETPDVVVLDAVDIRDTSITRDALESYRGRIDLAFLPAGASFQWQGYWNQMDSIAAADLAAWLDAKLVSACGGALSMSAPRQIGKIERYPIGRAEWQAAAVERLQPSRLLWRAPPLRVEYEKHQRRHIGLRRPNRLQRLESAYEVQALVSTFFTGYYPHEPVRRFRGPGIKRLQEQLVVWHPFQSALSEACDQFAYLLRRCHAEWNRTPAGFLVPNTLRHLLRSDAVDVAARLVALVPEPASDPKETLSCFFSTVEAMLRSEWNRSREERFGEALLCLAFDQDLALLTIEHQEMIERGRTDVLAHVSNEHVEALRRTSRMRRPILGPNHVWVDSPEIGLLTGHSRSNDVEGLLYYAHPEGVKVFDLCDVEVLILSLCDGRTVQEVACELAARLEGDNDVAEVAVFDLLSRLTRASIQLVDWTV